MNQEIKPYSYLIIKLLQGPVYNDNRETWNDIIDYQNHLRNHFNIIGIHVIINENEGYAFLKKTDDEEDDHESELPDLFVKRQLSYPVTMLSVLLVERLIEFDRTGGDAPFLIISRDDIIRMLKIFLEDKSNEARVVDNIDGTINRLLEFGFLRKLNNDKQEYEVRRILKAKIDADKLIEIKEKLKAYEPESA